MSGSDWRNMLTSTSRPEKPQEPPPEPINDEYLAYSTISSTQGAQQKLRLIFKNGDEEALDYSYNSRIRFRGSVITLYYTTGETVVIEGRNLNEKQDDRIPLYRGLVQHLITSVEEIDPLDAAVFADRSDMTVITRLEWNKASQTDD